MRRPQRKTSNTTLSSLLPEQPKQQEQAQNKEQQQEIKVEEIETLGTHAVVEDADGNTITRRLHLWEMQPTDTPKSFAAFKIYRDLGPSHRTAQKVADMIGVKDANCIKQWSVAHNWTARVHAFDNHVNALEEDLRTKEVSEVLKHNYANMHVRVKKLDEFATALEEQIFTDTTLPDGKTKKRTINKANMYIPGPKGDTFNQGLYSEWRAAMADIAAETGGRTKKQEISFKHMTDEELLRETFGNLLDGGNGNVVNFEDDDNDENNEDNNTEN